MSSTELQRPYNSYKWKKDIVYKRKETYDKTKDMRHDVKNTDTNYNYNKINGYHNDIKWHTDTGLYIKTGGFNLLIVDIWLVLLV